MNNLTQMILIALSFLIVSFGQPAWVPFFGAVAALIGYALYWKVLISFSSKKTRFWVSTLWFTAVQLVQLSWTLSHPFYYIYFVWVFFSLAVGLEFGLLSLLFDQKKITHIFGIFMIAGCWTLLEWSRLFLLSGYSWNPIGLALTGNMYSLQAASLFGVYGLSFIVILTNLLALRAFKLKRFALFVVVASAPYLYGALHLKWRGSEGESVPSINTVLLQTSFPVEEFLDFHTQEQFLDYVLGEWRHILKLSKKHLGKKVDLVVLPELVVPFGTYTFIFPYEAVVSVFKAAFGDDSLDLLPPLEFPLAYEQSENGETQWMVNNAYWTQALANAFDAPVVIGLEDAENLQGTRQYYSTATYIRPHTFEAKRYEKRVLVPMGEYIPFSFLRKIAAGYGIVGSFTPGESAKVWDLGDTSFGVSICYEETFGDMMRENRQLGANFLLNLTSDAWFPHSKLVRQHLEHSRLRSVENGFPIVRACNTGITCVVDSLGRVVAALDEKEDSADALFATVPINNYQTLYTHLGDGLIVGVSLLLVFLYFRRA